MTLQELAGSALAQSITFMFATLPLIGEKVGLSQVLCIVHCKGALS